MCGIAGFLEQPPCSSQSESLDRVTKMAHTLRHRGPDDAGAWADAAAGIALGHRRLSVVDLSATGHQPMPSACGRYVVSFNGEIYNFRSLRAELEQSGHRFRGHSDTEVLLAAITRWGVEGALARANGMFALALWDRQERVLFLARDRLGEKPLYYGWIGPRFLFASELKALCAHPDFRPVINRDAVALYLRHNYIPAPFSVYQDVAKLPPGTLLAVRAEAASVRGAPVRYWSARTAAESGVANPWVGTESEALAQLDDLLRDAIRMRMEADVPLGAFLSGGIDSTTVVALMQAQSTRPVRTFTIGFHEGGYNEAESAAEVARRLGTDHTELYVTPAEAMAVIPRLPALYDEPFADASQIPTFLVSQLARRHVTVSLSGDGGDELFGGYNRYFWGRSIWRKVGWLPAAWRRTAARTLTAVSPESWDTGFRALGPFLPGRLRQRNPGDKLHKLAQVLAVSDPEALYRGLISQWHDPAAVVPGAGEPPTTLTDRSQWANLDDFTLQMMYLDTVTYLPDDILVKVDRASMGVSLEARVPLLDHRVVEFAWRLPLAMKIRDGQGKWLLRQVLYQYVPREIMERPKMGFGVPIDAWLRGPLRDWAETLLDAKRLQEEGLFHPQPIRTRWTEHLSGQRNWQYSLWGVLMFQAWLDANATTSYAACDHRKC